SSIIIYCATSKVVEKGTITAPESEIIGTQHENRPQTVSSPFAYVVYGGEWGRGADRDGGAGSEGEHWTESGEGREKGGVIYDMRSDFWCCFFLAPSAHPLFSCAILLCVVPHHIDSCRTTPFDSVARSLFLL